MAAFLVAALWSCAAAAAEPAVVFDPPVAVTTVAGPGGSARGDRGEAARPAGFAVQLGFVLTDFSYAEYADGGALLDREDGLIPGVALGASWRPGAWEVAGEVGWSRRDVEYAGQTNTGVPIATTTGADLRNGALRASRWVDAGGVAVAPYAGLGFHHWDRAIRPTRTAAGVPVTGLDERYRWWTAELGVRARVLSTGHLSGWVDARLFRTLRSSVAVDFPTGHDDARLALGDRTGHRLGVRASYALARATDVTCELSYERWEFGRSRDEDLTRAGARVGTVHEPRSETRNLGAAFGVARRF